jgi:hypothetical protein
VALIRTDVSEDGIASIFRVHECEQVTERSCKLLYRQRLVEEHMEAIRSSETSVLIRATRRHLPEDDNHQYFLIFIKLLFTNFNNIFSSFFLKVDRRPYRETSRPSGCTSLFVNIMRDTGLTGNERHGSLCYNADLLEVASRTVSCMRTLQLVKSELHQRVAEVETL